MFRNTQYKVKQILELSGGIPEECEWIDYKAVRGNITKETKEKIKTLILSFLNSIQEFGNDKFIIWGIEEDKKAKEKKLTGLNEFKFPDDNEWQNLINDIKPNHPFVETGTFSYKGLLFGYIFISADNYNVPYHYSKEGKESYYIRHGSNKYDNITEEEKKQLTQKKEELDKNSNFFSKSDILNILVLLGQYNESNKADISFIEKITEKLYQDIKMHCLILDNSFSDKEKSIYGLGCSEAVKIQKKYERLLQFTSDELTAAKDVILGIFNSDDWYSEELLLGIADTLTFLANNGFEFIAESIIKLVINIDTFSNCKYRNIFQQIAEASPNYLLNLILEHKSEILEFKLGNKSTIIQSLRVIAWYPEFYSEATKLLLELDDKGIYELFIPTEVATAACFEQKLELIKEISRNNKTTAFEILNKVLVFNPNIPVAMSQNYVPKKYERFFESSHSLDRTKLQECYAVLLECADNCPEKLLKLLPDWLQPFPFSNLYLFAEHLERVEPLIRSANDRQKLWNRLCNTPLVYITNIPVEESIKIRLFSVGERFKPRDEYEQYQQWFRKSVLSDMCIGKTEEYNIVRVRQQVFEEQKSILLTLYKRDGIGSVISFIKMVENESIQLDKIMLSPEFPLSIEDDNALIFAFLSKPKIYSNFFYNKSYKNKLEWIKSLNLSSLSIEESACFFATLYPCVENIRYFECVLGNEKIKYWKLVELRCEDVSAIQYAFEQFIHFDMPQKAFKLLSKFYFVDNNLLDSNWISKALFKQGEYDKVYIQKNDFGFLYHLLIGKIGDNLLEQLEELSFKLYGKLQYHYGDETLKPRIIFRKIANEPKFFVEVTKYAITDSLSLCEHLLISCDEKPSKLQDWVKEIEYLISNEAESTKEKIDCWMGHILYNTLRIDSNGNYEIDDFVADLFEQSEMKRKGFSHKAYFPNGFHINGDFSKDSNDRAVAKRFNDFAVKQKEYGYKKFGETLQEIANKFIAGI